MQTWVKYKPPFWSTNEEIAKKRSSLNKIVKTCSFLPISQQTSNRNQLKTSNQQLKKMTNENKTTKQA